MDKELQLIAHLYDEPTSDSEPLRELLKDPDLASEYQALSEARFALDHRVTERPRPGLVNAIVRQAATKPKGAREDRPALRLLTFRRRSVLAGLSLAAALALTILVRPWTFMSDTQPVAATADNPFDFAVPAESLLRALPPAAAPVAASRNASQLPEWDSGEDLRRLSRRIQTLQAAGVQAWDEPAVPLEMLPGGASTGLTPAGQRR